MSLEDRPPFGPGPGPGPVREPPPGRATAAPPIVCYLIIGISAALYLYEVARAGGDLLRPEHIGVLYGPALQAGQLWRLATHVFEHGGAIHLVLNMSVVLTLGTTFERSVGHGIFAVVSFIAALGSATIALLFSFDVPMVGASGMILGWAGAILPIATDQGRRALGTWLVQMAIISFLPFVSWQGHLGGFLFGLVCGFALKLGRKPFWMLAPVLAIVSVGAALAASRWPLP